MKHKEELKKKLLTIKEVEEIFRISRSTVYRHAKSGLFRKIKLGQKVFFDADEIRRIIEK